MPDSKARTAAGKQRFVKKAMGEFKAGEMKSGSGETVTNPKQAIAIALSQTGQTRKPAARSASGSTTERLADRVSRRLAARTRRS
jgi:hypothetical protein